MIKKQTVILVIAVFVLGALAGWGGSPAAAQPVMSVGCMMLNEPFWDQGPWTSLAMINVGDPWELYAGEIISVTAGPPDAGPPTGFQFEINSTPVISGSYPGTLLYSVPADRADITSFMVSVTGVEPMATFSVECVAPVPGCDALIAIPSTAVGAKITADTLAYWAPGQATDTLLKAGTSVRAIAQEDGWYEILFACDFLYVPVGTIGPNPESPWFGAPLP